MPGAEILSLIAYNAKYPFLFQGIHKTVIEFFSSGGNRSETLALYPVFTPHKGFGDEYAL